MKRIFKDIMTEISPLLEKLKATEHKCSMSKYDVFKKK
jgi:hypothetical protein